MSRRAVTAAAVLTLLAGAAAPASDVSETHGLKVRSYDRRTGRLSARLAADRSDYLNGVFVLKKVAIRSYGAGGSIVDTSAPAGRYEKEKGFATLTGDVRVTYQPVDGTDERADIRLKNLEWTQGADVLTSDSEVDARFLRGGRAVAELKGRGLEIDTASGLIRLAKPEVMKLRGGLGLIGRLDRPATGSSDGRPVTVRSKGPIRLVMPKADDPLLRISVKNDVTVTEPEGSLGCDGLTLALRREGPAGGMEAGGYLLDSAEATGDVSFRSGESTATAPRAEYAGAADLLLLSGDGKEGATLTRQGQTLAAPRILIDRRNRKTTTGGKGDTRLTIRRPEEAVKPRGGAVEDDGGTGTAGPVSE